MAKNLLRLKTTLLFCFFISASLWAQNPRDARPKAKKCSDLIKKPLPGLPPNHMSLANIYDFKMQEDFAITRTYDQWTEDLRVVATSLTDNYKTPQLLKEIRDSYTLHPELTNLFYDQKLAQEIHFLINVFMDGRLNGDKLKMERANSLLLDRPLLVKTRLVYILGRQPIFKIFREAVIEFEWSPELQGMTEKQIFSVDGNAEDL